MRKFVCRTLGRLLYSARAPSQGGSRLDSGSASLGASHSLHSGAGEAHWCTCSDISSFQPHSQTLQARPAHSKSTRTCCPSLAHGSSFCQHRSFASNGRDETDTSQQLGPPGPSGVSQPPPSEQEGSSVGETPQQSSAAESDVQHPSGWAASADLSGGAEGQGAQSEADAESRDPWALTEEQRQAERVLLSPPSGEPLYPTKRGSFAWEPFSDDGADDEMTVRPCIDLKPTSSDRRSTPAALLDGPWQCVRYVPSNPGAATLCDTLSFDLPDALLMCR